jgi:uncharacterized protein YjbJ (UPF0337 family)
MRKLRHLEKDVPFKLGYAILQTKLPMFPTSLRSHGTGASRATRLQPLPFHDDKTARDRKRESTFMDSSTHDKAEGTAKEAFGKVKEETGKAIGNQDLQNRGTAEKVGGKVERKVGDVKKVFGK